MTRWHNCRNLSPTTCKELYCPQNNLPRHSVELRPQRERTLFPLYDGWGCYSHPVAEQSSPLRRGAAKRRGGLSPETSAKGGLSPEASAKGDTSHEYLPCHCEGVRSTLKTLSYDCGNPGYNMSAGIRPQCFFYLLDRHGRFTPSR